MRSGSFSFVSGAILFLLIAITPSCTTSAQTSRQQQQADKAASVKNMITDRNYIFVAQTVLPMSGRIRHLTTEYDMEVHKDTLKVYLPYFGRAYTAPIDPSKGGFQFTSTDFDYSQENGKKGSWNIVIKPRDENDVQQLSLNVFTNGSASLQVTSNSRQPISFNGFVRERKEDNKE